MSFPSRCSRTNRSETGPMAAVWRARRSACICVSMTPGRTLMAAVSAGSSATSVVQRWCSAAFDAPYAPVSHVTYT